MFTAVPVVLMLGHDGCVTATGFTNPFIIGTGNTETLLSPVLLLNCISREIIDVNSHTMALHCDPVMLTGCKSCVVR